MVRLFVLFAVHNGWDVRWYMDPKTGPEWPVVSVELPTGQVTWHIAREDFESMRFGRVVPQLSRDWDGHDTARKIGRLMRLASELEASALEAAAELIGQQLTDLGERNDDGQETPG